MIRFLPHAQRLLLLLAILWLLPLRPATAQAVRCDTAAMSELSFGSVDLVRASGFATTASLTYSCRNDTPQPVTICLNIGDPYGSFADRRLRQGSNDLRFQIYQDAARTMVWGTVWGGPATPPKTLVVAAGARVSGTLPIHAAILPGQDAVPGPYSASYAGNGTLINYRTGSSGACSTGDPVVGQASIFPFHVSANVVKACLVTAGPAADVNLGTVSADAINTAANGRIAVTCSQSTPYVIGLHPSNGSATGSGTMSATTGSADRVPYQLYQDPGMRLEWGHADGPAGNGVGGTGTGRPQSHTVYVRAPSADYRPGRYSDTVTVIVSY